MLDVLFISMRPYRRYYDDFMALSPPLGLGYLSLSLSKNSISSKIIYLLILQIKYLYVLEYIIQSMNWDHYQETKIYLNDEVIF